MDPLSITASVLTVLQATEAVISICCNYRAASRGASWEVSRVLEEIRNLRDVLRTLEDLADNIETKGKTGTVYLPALRQMCEPSRGTLTQCLQTMKALEKKLVPPSWAGPTGSMRSNLAQALRWPLQKAETVRSLEKVEQLKSALNLAISLDQAPMLATVHNITVNRSVAARRRDILEWLDAPNPSSKYRKALQKRHAGTGVWYIDGEAFKRWTREPGSFSWLFGILGCGKTVLSASIIERLSELCLTRPLSTVAYYYFAFDDQAAQDVEGMIRSLTAQLCSRCTTLPSAMESLYNTCSRGQTQPTFDALRIVLSEVLDAFDEVFIVLDALDECVERENLLTTLETIAQWQKPQLRFMVTSRKEWEIEQSLELFVKEANRICIQGAGVEDDIKACVLDRLRMDRRLKRWQKPELEQEIQRALISRAGGMFHWVFCQLDTLAKCRTLAELRRALSSLPKNLDDTYTRILQAIDDEGNHHHVWKILQFLILNGTIRIDEAAEIVAVDLDSVPQFDAERRLVDPDDTLSMCSALVNVQSIETVGTNGITRKTTTLRLTHFSIQEFLLSERIQSSSVSHWYIEKLSANLFLARACLAYLIFLEGRGGYDESGGMAFDDDYHQEYPLARIAASRWPDYLHAVETSTTPYDPIALKLFMADNSLHRLWLQLQQHCSYCEDLVDMALATDDVGVWPGSLYLAAHFGLPQTVRDLLGRGIDVNESYPSGIVASHFTPLMEASRLGHAAVIRELIAYQAGVNHRNLNHGTALMIACHSGHNIETIQLLVNHGADLLVKTDDSVTALHIASNAQELHTVAYQAEIVKILLVAGASINARSTFQRFRPLELTGTPIEIAVKSHSSPLVLRILLDHGADGAVGLVSAASTTGAEEAVRFFLESGVHIDARARVRLSYSPTVIAHCTALGAVCGQPDFYELFELARLLLQFGADPNVRTEAAESVLELALNNDNRPHGDVDEILRLLLDYGADLDLVRSQKLNRYGAMRFSIASSSRSGNERGGGGETVVQS